VVSCAECGFRGEAKSNAELVLDARRFAARYAVPLTRFLPTDDVPGVLPVHEGHHHLLDIGRSLRAARGRA
jgi:hypothetical protein